MITNFNMLHSQRLKYEKRTLEVCEEGIGNMDPWLKMSTTLVEDWRSHPNTHIGQLTTT